MERMTGLIRDFFYILSPTEYCVQANVSETHQLSFAQWPETWEAFLEPQLQAKYSCKFSSVKRDSCLDTRFPAWCLTHFS